MIFYRVLFLSVISLYTWSGEVKIMSYNVENLFDTKHDQGKNDWTFLPLTIKEKANKCKSMHSKYRRDECFKTDWTQDKLNLKISQIKKVVTARGYLPDILALIEVENMSVLKILAKELGYKGIIETQSADLRGIDVALLYNPSSHLKLLSSKEHILSAKSFAKKPTRNILEALFSIGEEKVYFFVNHWPSLANPDQARVEAAQLTMRRIKELKKAEPLANYISLGDFNTIDKLKKGSKIHPFRDVLLKDSDLVDVHYRALELKGREDLKDIKGTYFYRRNQQWNLLDRIFVNRGLLDEKGLKLDLHSYKIFNDSFLLKSFKTKKGVEQIPFEYDHSKSNPKEVGYSDHLPIVFNLKF